MRNRSSHRYQAKVALWPFRAIGIPRHGNKGSKRIHSLSTFNAYRDAATLLSRWLRLEYDMDLLELEEDYALEYLRFRAAHVGQKTLDRDRQAIQMLLQDSLPKVIAGAPNDELATRSRACTAEQAAIITSFLPQEFQLPARFAGEAGLRARELLDLLPRDERAPSSRDWAMDRFDAATLAEPRMYTTRGKGGLIREIQVSRCTAEHLEEHRLAAQVEVRDRSIYYRTSYGIPGGQRISQAWTVASQRAFGWSNGFHSLRHAFAQRRLRELLAAGYTFHRAILVIAHEMGHFDPRTTLRYLR